VNVLAKCSLCNGTLVLGSDSGELGLLTCQTCGNVTTPMETALITYSEDRAAEVNPKKYTHNLHVDNYDVTKPDSMFGDEQSRKAMTIAKEFNKSVKNLGKQFGTEDNTVDLLEVGGKIHAQLRLILSPKTGGPYRTNRPQKMKSCKMCGAQFPSRTNRVYCTPACRVRWFRAQKNQGKAWEEEAAVILSQINRK